MDSSGEARVTSSWRDRLTHTEATWRGPLSSPALSKLTLHHLQEAFPDFSLGSFPSLLASGCHSTLT